MSIKKFEKKNKNWKLSECLNFVNKETNRRGTIESATYNVFEKVIYNKKKKF